jgi:hypothetical protein
MRASDRKYSSTPMSHHARRESEAIAQRATSLFAASRVHVNMNIVPPGMTDSEAPDSKTRIDSACRENAP